MDAEVQWTKIWDFK